MHRRCITALIVSLLSIATAPSKALAQELASEADLSKVPPEVLQEVQKLSNTLKGVVRKYEKLPPGIKGAPVVAVIKGKEGVPLPSQDAVEAPYKLSEQQVADYKAQGEEIARTSIAKLTREHQEMPELPHVSTCSESSTDKLPIKGMQRGNQVMLDSMYIHEADVPTKPLEVFGVDTYLYVYKNDKHDPLSQSIATLMAGGRITCLPYRTRMVAGMVYVSRGGDALKNYEANPHGAGKIHPDLSSLFRMRGWK